MVRKVVSALLLLFLVGCSDPPKSGYVVQKVYDDEDNWSYQQPLYMPICSGNPPTCSQMLYGFQTVYGHDDAHWEFRIKDDADPKGKKHGWVEISKETYDQYDVGMHWPDAR